MLEQFESIGTRLQDLSVSEIFERPARNWEDVEAINLVSQSTACLLLDIYLELKDLKDAIDNTRKLTKEENN